MLLGFYLYYVVQFFVHIKRLQIYKNTQSLVLVMVFTAVYHQLCSQLGAKNTAELSLETQGKGAS